MFEVCTIMLYNALATVLVRTVPAFRLVMATIKGCTYGIAYIKTDRIQVVHGLRVVGKVSSAMSKGRTQNWLIVHSRKRSLIFSDKKHQKSKLRMKMTYAGIVSMFVVNVP